MSEVSRRGLLNSAAGLAAGLACPLTGCASSDPQLSRDQRVALQKRLKELGHGVNDFEGRIDFAFRAAVSRKPDEQELRVVKTRYQLLLARYRKDTKAAAEMVKAGKGPRAEKLDVAEYAAWTGLANLLLNLDETLTRE